MTKTNLGKVRYDVVYDDVGSSHPQGTIIESNNTIVGVTSGTYNSGGSNRALFQSTPLLIEQNDPADNALIISTLPKERGEFDGGLGSTIYEVGDIVSKTTSYYPGTPYHYEEVEKFICIKTNGTYTSGQGDRTIYGKINPTGWDSTYNIPADDAWRKISTGTFNKKFAWLGDVNAGHIGHEAIRLWDAQSGYSGGSIRAVNITNIGGGFSKESPYVPAGITTTAVVSLDNPGFGTGFEAVAAIAHDGTISHILIRNPGINYNDQSGQITGTVTGGTSTATFTCIVNGTNNNNGLSQKGTHKGTGTIYGRFKGHGRHNATTGGEGAVTYVNRRHGLMSSGYVTGSRGGFGNSGTHPFLSESCFVHKSWLDGTLPTPDGLPPKIIQVEAGLDGTLVLFNNGEVHYSGYNGHGQGGTGDTATQYGFRQCGYSAVGKGGGQGTTVFRDKRVIRIAMSGDGNSSANSCYALVEENDGDRAVYAWGYNGYGQLGQGNTTNLSVPTLVCKDDGTNWTSTDGRILEIWANGSNYGNLWVYSSKGKLFGCGYNGQGQMADDTTTNRSTLQLVFDAGTFRNIRKFTYGGGNNVPGFRLLLEGIPVHTQTELWSWGYNAIAFSLGHGHNNNVHTPIRVYTEGYPTTNTTVTSANKDTFPASGTALTDVQDVWCSGPDSASSFIARGTSRTSNTLYGVGQNNYQELSIRGTPGTAGNDATNRNVYTECGVNDGDPLNNVIDVVQAGNAYDPVFFRTTNDWYVGGYNNYRIGFDPGPGYNIDQGRDPDALASNYRAKNNMHFPTAWDKTKFTVTCMANTTSGITVFIKTDTGEMLGCGTDNSYYAIRSQGQAYTMQRLSNH